MNRMLIKGFIKKAIECGLDDKVAFSLGRLFAGQPKQTSSIKQPNLKLLGWKPQNDREKRVHNLVVNQLGIDPNILHPNAHLVKHLGADDLDKIEMTMAIEEEFGHEIPDHQMEKFHTFGDMLKHVNKWKRVSSSNARSYPSYRVYKT